MGTRIFRDAALEAPATRPVKTYPFFKLDGSVDLLLILVLIAFIVYGLLMVYSASTDYSWWWYESAFSQFHRQIMWMVLGIVVAGIAAFVDYHNWHKLALPTLLGTLVFLLIVLVINKTGNSESNVFSRAFLNGSIQPSELAKAMTIIYLAVWINSKREILHQVGWGLIPLIAIIGLVAGVILAQPDYSAALTVVVLGGMLFFLGGGEWKQIVLMLVGVTILSIFVVGISTTGKARFSDYIAGLVDLTKASEHLVYSFQAIVKGGWFGVGFGRSSMKLLGLPFAPTDSIFAVIAEELGLFGVFGTVSLYVMLVWRGLRIANRAPDMLGSLLASSLTLWIGFEALMNMLVMVGLLPFAGNALPFISYGGSSLLTTMGAVGILMNVSRHYQPETEKEEWRSFGASADLRGRNRRRSLSRISRP
jgi:cell division protein FtsW